jgi:hypothetical protein
VITKQGYTQRGDVTDFGGEILRVNGLFTPADEAKLDAIVAFIKVAVSGQSDINASGFTDTLTFAAGTGMTITTNAGTKTVTFESSGGGSLSLNVDGGDSDSIYPTILGIDGGTASAVYSSSVFDGGNA